MKIREEKNLSFKSAGLYNLTAKVQENTLLNRGLLDIGGVAIPQAAMSNNKDEAIERGSMSAIYFFLSFLTPFFMLPFFNKQFLRKNGIVKELKNNEKRIIEVSKEFLTKDADHMVMGIREKAKSLKNEEGELLTKAKGKKKEKLENLRNNIVTDFENVLNRHKDKEELRQKLLKAHKQVFFADFLTTSLMWCATPWVATGITEKRTKRKTFSATYNMKEETEADIAKVKKDKKKKLIASALIATVPALIVPKLAIKGIGKDLKPLLESKNIAKKGYGEFLNLFKKFPKNFNYTQGMFMSKTIFALMWLLCDYPSALVSSRDKYERRDRAIRYGGMLVTFFGGDYILNNTLGRLSDEFNGTNIMGKKSKSFWKNFKLSPRNFKEIPKTKEMMKTRNVGAAMYWATLVANMGLIGFATPALLNWMLKNSIQKEKESAKVQNTDNKKLLMALNLIMPKPPAFEQFKI